MPPDPFEDGNGRTARLLSGATGYTHVLFMESILMRCHSVFLFKLVDEVTAIRKTTFLTNVGKIIVCKPKHIFCFI